MIEAATATHAPLSLFRMSWADRLRQTLPQKADPPPSSSGYNRREHERHRAATAAAGGDLSERQHHHPQRKRSNSFNVTTTLLLGTFSFLSARELALVCSRVCRAWRDVSHEPEAWHAAWAKHAYETELIFGRVVFDPLPAILRLAGIRSDATAERENASAGASEASVAASSSAAAAGSRSRCPRQS